MFESVLLGAIQGVTEWLPVSSEGVVALVYVALFDRPVSEAVAYALYLHVGTALSAAVAFRGEILRLFSELVSLPKRPSRLLSYLFVATAVSGVAGFPLLLTLEELPSDVGVSAMALVGTLMLITGGVQLFRSTGGVRGSDDASVADALIAGLAQGMAVLPGLSRSGLTVAALLMRRIDRRACLMLSFLMSIPVSVAASAYVVVSDGTLIGAEGIVAGLVSFLVGLLTIKGLVGIAERVNFGPFVIAVGILMIAGAVWQTIAI